MNLRAAILLALSLAALPAACSTSPTGDPRATGGTGNCYATCGELAALGSPDPEIDACTAETAGLATALYACTCQFSTGSDPCISCRDTCTGAPLLADCKACARGRCMAQINACESQPDPGS